jgi:hypothetical protein
MENASFNPEENKQVAPIVALAQLDHNVVAKTIIAGIENGDVDPLDLHMFLKKTEKIVETVGKNKEVKEILIKEANKHIIEGKAFDYKGASLKVGPTYTFTDYSACGDPLWDNLAELEKSIKEMKKDREAFLKNAFPESSSLYGSINPVVVVQQLFTLTPADCGEEITLMKPIKKQTMGVVTTFHKSPK